MSNFFAQTEALMRGKNEAEARAELEASGLGCAVQGSAPVAVARVDAGAPLEQLHHDGNVPMERGFCERADAVGTANVRVGLLGEQLAGGMDGSGACRHVKRRDIAVYGRLDQAWIALEKTSEPGAVVLLDERLQALARASGAPERDRDHRACKEEKGDREHEILLSLT